MDREFWRKCFLFKKCNFIEHQPFLGTTLANFPLGKEIKTKKSIEKPSHKEK